MSNLILLTGDDEYSRNKALETLCEDCCKKGASRDDMRIFYAGDAGVSEIIESASTLPLFSTLHLIIVRDLENIPKDDRKPFLSFCENIPDFTFLILIADEKSIDKTFYKSLSKYAQVKKFKKPYDNEVPAKVKEILKAQDKQITAQALSILTFSLGNDLASIEAAVEKLSLYIHPERLIKVDAIEKMIELDAEYNSFALTEALSNRDIRKSLIVLGRLLENGAKPHELIGVLGWQFGRFKKAKQMLGEGADDGDIASLLRINNFFLKKFMQQLSQFSELELDLDLARLLKADIAIKSSYSSDTDRLLDILLVELAGK